MKFSVEQILNLPDMKVLDFQEIQGAEIIITIEKAVDYSTCPHCGKTTYSIHQNKRADDS